MRSRTRPTRPSAAAGAKGPGSSDEVAAWQLSRHIDGKRTMQRALYDAETLVTRIEQLVLDIEGEAKAKDFSISRDGVVTDTGTPPTFENRYEARSGREGDSRPPRASPTTSPRSWGGPRRSTRRSRAASLRATCRSWTTTAWPTRPLPSSRRR